MRNQAKTRLTPLLLLEIKPVDPRWKQHELYFWKRLVTRNILGPYVKCSSFFLGEVKGFCKAVELGVDLVVDHEA